MPIIDKIYKIAIAVTAIILLFIMFEYIHDYIERDNDEKIIKTDLGTLQHTIDRSVSFFERMSPQEMRLLEVSISHKRIIVADSVCGDQISVLISDLKNEKK